MNPLRCKRQQPKKGHERHSQMKSARAGAQMANRITAILKQAKRR